MLAPSGYRYRTRDAARRMADTVALHQVALSSDEKVAGRYIAVRLSDGGSDGVAYPSRAEAIRHQRHNGSRCIYPRIPLERWSAKTCDVLLWYARIAYDQGHREDPAHQLWVPTQEEHHA
jgi:hypothetical protein